MDRDLFVRSKANPIIKPSDLPFNVNGVLNPGVALVDEEIVLLLRIENRRGVSGLYAVRPVGVFDQLGVLCIHTTGARQRAVDPERVRTGLLRRLPGNPVHGTDPQVPRRGAVTDSRGGA